MDLCKTFLTSSSLKIFKCFEIDCLMLSIEFHTSQAAQCVVGLGYPFLFNFIWVGPTNEKNLWCWRSESPKKPQRNRHHKVAFNFQRDDLQKEFNFLVVVDIKCEKSIIVDLFEQKDVDTWK